jgi:phosphatidylserine/phosphatidylglycerophosphate/cardiolipin synthase-like enzyme
MMSDPQTSTPPWIVDLAVAASSLNAAQLQLLASSYRTERAPIVLSASQLQRRLAFSTADATELARNLRQILTASHVTGGDIAIALATLAHARSARIHGDDQVEVVCTAPSRLGVPLRTTFATAVEMVHEAQQTIIVMGYVFTGGARALIEQLAVARRDRAVHVTLIGNRIHDQLTTVRSMWPADSPAPAIFSRETSSDDNMAAMHAKLLICDSIAALITSANFSHHGLHENIEVGVKICSPSVTRLVDFIQAMIRMGEFKAVK